MFLVQIIGFLPENRKKNTEARIKPYRFFFIFIPFRTSQND